MDVQAKKQLIVNADDFGLSPGVNRGILEAHQHGIVTSASLMVRQPAADQAVASSREYRALGLGLHLDLGEWAFRNGTWVPLYEVVPLDESTAVAEEVVRQLLAFRTLVGKNPTHLDSHQHVHLREPIRSVVVNVARELALPLRCCSRTIHYCGQFYGQTTEGISLPDALSVEALIALLEHLPDGVTELGTHPGYPGGLETMYGGERAREISALCDPHVHALVKTLGIVLRSFGDISEEPDA